MTFEKRPLPRIWTVEQLRQKVSNLPPPLLGQGMLMPGNTSLMAGPEGAGKTYVSLKLADCVAGGKNFGKIPTKKAKVLLLSEEMTDDELKVRSDEFAWTHRGGVDIVFRPRLQLHTDAGLHRLFEAIDRSQAELCLIDHLRAAHGAKEDNDSLAPILGGLREVAIRCQCAITLLHHFRKTLPGQRAMSESDDVRGGGILKAEVSDIFLVTRDTRDRLFCFKKARFQAELEPMRFQIGYMDGRMDVLWS